MLEYLNDPDIQKINEAILISDEEIKKSETLDSTPIWLKDKLTEYKSKYIDVVQTTRGYLYLTSVVMPAETQEVRYLSKQLKKVILSQTEPIKLAYKEKIIQTKTRILAISLVLFFLSILFSFIISNSINKPLLQLSRTFRRLANNESVDLIPGTNLKDEIGEMSRSAEVFRQKNDETNKLLSELDRKKLELEISREAISEGLKFKELIMDHIPDMVFVKDTEFRIVQANTALLNVYPEEIRENVIGSTTFESYDEKEVEAFLKYDKQAFAEGYSEVEETILFPDGQNRTLHTQKIRFTDKEGEKFILCIARDITEFKASEEKLHEYNEKITTTNNFLKSILEYAVDGIITINEKGIINSVNPATEKIFAYSEEEMVGNNVKMLMPSPDQEKHDGYLQNYHDTKKKKIIGIGREVTGKRKDGSTFPMELSVSENKAGDSISFTGIVRDISERKEYEKSLQERTDALQRSNEELERFAYVASHDLQEPLRMVASYTNLIANRYKDKLDDDANEFINYAVDGAKRMQALINDLLAISRINTSDEELTLVDIDVLVEKILADLDYVIDEKNNVVISKDKLPEVKGQETLLYQLFQNLITNAAKYTDPTRKNTIHISATKEGAQWQFSIADTGIGIAPEFFEKIFIIFKRLHARDAYTGTGIGLALCKKIVEKHEGKIWLESVPGEGSTFIFTLPEK